MTGRHQAIWTRTYNVEEPDRLFNGGESEEDEGESEGEGEKPEENPGEAQGSLEEKRPKERAGQEITSMERLIQIQESFE